MNLSGFQRLNLFSRPTPLNELTGLQKELACKPRIFMKRDDLTQLGLGGNKNRKLDFVMAEALSSGADVIITWAGVQSNHCRQTLAVARHLGMDCHLVLSGKEPPVRQGNLLYYTILKANLHFVPDNEDLEGFASNLAEELKKKGQKPFIVPIGASTPLGALGYVESVKEAIEQGQSQGVRFGHAFVATGSAGTQAGAEVGARELCPSMRIHGVSVSRDAEPQREQVAKVVNETYDLLGLNKTVSPDDIIVHDEYYGGEYAVPTQAGNDAIRLVAQTEGILLDPVYTGKAMSGMIDMLRKGELDHAEAVLFFHTGGYPAIFAFADYFQE
ncbi:MAG: D-cysteine desulfhydrase family protein [Bacillota bacterium]|jgi:L-cysteate sulfo-lyase